MHYYYDILVNLDDELWEFYEWDQKDQIIPIKKIPLVRVTEADLQAFLKYDVVFDSLWVQKFLEKAWLKNQKEKLSCVLFSSTKNCLVFELDDSGNVLSRSKLLLEDENHCNEVTCAIHNSIVPYKIKEKRRRNGELRQATLEKKFIAIELKTLEETKNEKKCAYLYYEWFGKFEPKMEKMIQDMKRALKKTYSMKLHDIALLIKMSYKEQL